MYPPTYQNQAVARCTKAKNARKFDAKFVKAGLKNDVMRMNSIKKGGEEKKDAVGEMLRSPTSKLGMRMTVVERDVFILLNWGVTDRRTTRRIL